MATCFCGNTRAVYPRPKLRVLMHAAHMSRSVKQLRLLRGQFSKLLNNSALSEELRESALREFDRLAERSRVLAKAGA